MKKLIIILLVVGGLLIFSKLVKASGKVFVREHISFNEGAYRDFYVIDDEEKQTTCYVMGAGAHTPTVYVNCIKEAK